MEVADVALPEFPTGTLSSFIGPLVGIPKALAVVACGRTGLLNARRQVGKVIALLPKNKNVALLTTGGLVSWLRVNAPSALNYQFVYFPQVASVNARVSWTPST